MKDFQKRLLKRKHQEIGAYMGILSILYTLCWDVPGYTRLRIGWRMSCESPPKGPKVFFSEHWRLVKNGEVAVFFNWKAGETRSEVQQNGEILKCGKSDEIMKSNTNANLFFFLFVSILWTVRNLIFRHFEAFERLVQRGPLGPNRPNWPVPHGNAETEMLSSHGLGN